MEGDDIRLMEAERCTFFGPLPLVYIPIVADRRRKSPLVADSRPKNSRNEEKVR